MPVFDIDDLDPSQIRVPSGGRRPLEKAENRQNNKQLGGDSTIMYKKPPKVLAITVMSLILTSLAAPPASAAQYALVNSQLEPVCVTRGWPRKKEDCSIRDAYRLIQTSDRAVRAMHLQLAEGEVASSPRSQWVAQASTPGAACVGLMREEQLKLLPELAKSKANFEKGLVFIKKVEFILELADRKSQGQALFKALAESGLKGAGKQLAKEAGKEISPDVKAGLFELANALAIALSPHRFAALVRANYFYAVRFGC